MWWSDSGAPGTLRGQLARRLTVGSGVILLVLGWSLGRWIEGVLTEAFDGSLKAAAAGIAGQVVRSGEVLELEGDPSGGLSLWEGENGFDLRFDAGRPIRAYGPALWDVATDSAAQGAVFRDGLASGRRYRTVRLRFLVAEEVDEENGAGESLESDEVAIPAALRGDPLRLELVVGRDRASLDAQIGAVRRALAIGGGAITVLLVVLVGVTLRGGLRGLDRLGEQLEALGPETLRGRVRLEKAPRELAGIVRSVNELLDRLEAGFERERRFVSDVAHELRTPVAELRAACEVGQRWPEDIEANAELFGDVQAVAERMDRVVGSLLMLARGRNGVSVGTEIELGRTLKRSWERVADEAEKKGMTCVMRGVDGMRVGGDAAAWEMIAFNLLDNAVHYGGAGTAVQCEAIAEGGCVEVTVRNHAPGFEAADVGKVFDRFWRKDAARSDRHRMGIGLPLVRTLCEGMGWKVDAEFGAGDMFEVRVRGMKLRMGANEEDRATPSDASIVS